MAVSSIKQLLLVKRHTKMLAFQRFTGPSPLAQRRVPQSVQEMWLHVCVGPQGGHNNSHSVVLPMLARTRKTRVRRRLARVRGGLPELRAVASRVLR
jgi:hypothetical protein